MPPLVTLFLNESQIFAGMIDGIKLVRTHQTKHLQASFNSRLIDMFDIRQLIRHSRLDVTFCDCRLRGAGSIVRDSTFNYY